MKNIRFFLFLFILLASSIAHAQKSALLWSTYFGGDTTTYGGSVATDDSGNVYISGVTFSAIGIATKGAYKTNGDTNGEVFLAKFSPSGSLLWATYYGDSDEADWTHVDKSGNVYITGLTSGYSGMATSGTYLTSFGGRYYEAFLAKFSSTGDLIWGTYYGGGGGDDGLGITTDRNNNVYITGTTRSTTGIATSGAYQTIGDSVEDKAFLAKFSTSGNLLWGTYFGGNKADDSYGVDADTSGNIYISGTTNSTIGIATKGAHQTLLGDSAFGDAFLAKFSKSGGLLWATYFGENSYTYGLGLTTDLFSNVYIAGSTSSTTGIATSGAYQTYYAGGAAWGDAFIAKFDAVGGLIWATYYGGNNDEECDDLASDIYGNVYITGYTNSTSGITTYGAYQEYNNAAGYETYLTKFDKSGNLLYGTYYAEDEGQFLATNNDNVYVYGNTGGNNGGDYLAKFHIPFFYNDAGISSIISPKESSCEGLTLVEVQLKNYGPDTLKAVKIICSINNEIKFNYTWAGNLLSGNSTSVSLGNYSFKPGIDTIKAWTEPIGFTDTVPGNDTAKIVDTINPLPTTPIITLSGDTLTSIAKTGNQWYKDSVLIKSATNQKYVATSNGNYSVMVTDSNGCSATSKPVNYTTTGIEEVSNNLKINIYPNPFTNQTTITGALDGNNNVSISIYDMTGRVIVEKNGERGAGERFEYTFDAVKYGCGSGIYIVKLTVGDAVVTREMVRMKN